MTIQTINLTVPGGDTPRSANTKINANFTDPTNAASKLVGRGAGQVPLAQDVYSCAYNQASIKIADAAMYPSCNDLPIGSRYYINNRGLADAPPISNAVIDTFSTETTTTMQISWSRGEVGVFARVKTSTWSTWVPISTNAETYKTTTAAGANVVVDNTGTLMRSTSSERYKDILAPLELDDARYDDAMALKPIVYRSTADADNPAYHYYSFSAEELGAYDPAFTLWRDTETVTDADGNVTEQPLSERQAEGININALLAMSHAIAIKQGELIKDLQDQVIEQREAIASLQQANP